MKPEGSTAEVVMVRADGDAVEMQPPEPINEGAASVAATEVTPLNAELCSPLKLFRHASWFDVLCLVFGCIFTGAVGLAQPVMIILFADMFAATGSLMSGNASKMIEEMINTICVRFTIVGGALFVCAWLSEACFKSSGIRQSAAWRKNYIKSIMRQDVGWYDVNQPNELPSRVAANTQAIELGISSKLSFFVRYLVQGLGGLLFAIIYKWDMALVLVGCASSDALLRFADPLTKAAPP